MRSNDYQLSCDQLQNLARFNLFASLVVSFGYSLLVLFFPATFGIGLGLSYAGAILLSGIRPYLEHGGTSYNRSAVARTWSTPLSGLIFGNINYHQAHHLFPGVPAYRMVDLQKWLERNGHISDRAIRSSNHFELWQVVSHCKYGITQSDS